LLQLERGRTDLAVEVDAVVQQVDLLLGEVIGVMLDTI
jgi:hypothetical protein